MDALWIFAIGAAIVAVLFLALRGSRQRPPTTRSTGNPFAASEITITDERIVLDIEAQDPTSQAVQRLAMDAAHRALATAPSLRRVVVTDRSGRILLEFERDEAPIRDVTVPDALRSHGPRSGATPSATPRGDRPLPEQHHEVRDHRVPRRAFADRFDLPPAVRAAISDADHPADVLAALLTTGGHRAERHGDLVLVDDDVAVVLADVTDDVEQALTRAYLRYRNSGAAHGLIVRIGYADPAVVARRDAATPDVRYTDADAVQRMADAVAVGLDPLPAAIGAPLVHGPLLR